MSNLGILGAAPGPRANWLLPIAFLLIITWLVYLMGMVLISKARSIAIQSAVPDAGPIGSTWTQVQPLAGGLTIVGGWISDRGETGAFEPARPGTGARAMPGCHATLHDPEQTLEALHIAGLSVRAAPSNVWAVQDAVGRLPGAEIHAVTDDGRMVITIEDVNERQILAAIATISDLAGVISLALAFHQVQSLSEAPGEVRDGNEPS